MSPRDKYIIELFLRELLRNLSHIYESRKAHLISPEGDFLDIETDGILTNNKLCRLDENSYVVSIAALRSDKPAYKKSLLFQRVSPGTWQLSIHHDKFWHLERDLRTGFLLRANFERKDVERVVMNLLRVDYQGGQPMAGPIVRRDDGVFEPSSEYKWTMGQNEDPDASPYLSERYSPKPTLLQRMLNVTGEVIQKIPSLTDIKPDYVVWFGTNRKPIDIKDLSLGFTGERDSTVRYGTCNVKVPKSHKFGSTGSPWWKRWLTRKDDRLKILRLNSYAETAFWAAVKKELSQANESQAVIYIHGYNVSFENAALRAAQIGVDLKVPGLMAFFSWPSKGSTTLYTHDEVAVEASEAALTDFLKNFVTQTGVTKVHVIAHSMGNRGFLRALQRIQADVDMKDEVKFGQIFLAAPDVDVDLFKNLAHLYSTFSERTTLYVSPADKALGVSKWLHGYSRAGLTPPVTVIPNIDTIEVPLFDLMSLGHSFYADAAGPLHDIFDLIRRNGDPHDRQRLSLVTLSGGSYWTMAE